MRRKQQTKLTVLIFGIAMSLIMVASLMAGWLQNVALRMNAVRQQRAALEPTAVPTFQPPIAIDGITFDEQALQANGVFSIAVPEPPEWGAVESSFDSFSNRARLLLRNDINVIEAIAESPQTPVANTEELSTLYNQQSLGASWRNYSSWTETQRSTVSRNGRDYLQLDFELEYQNRTYVARQASWVEGGNVYSVRVITPENATDLLVYLLDNVVDSFSVNSQFANVPISWKAYYDAALEHVIRYPETWALTDAAEGLPASIETNDTALRVEALADTSVEDEAAAEQYVETLPNVTDITSVVPVERDGISGFSVAYEMRTLEGESGSGVVVLLNGEGELHVANLSVKGIDADLNETSDDEAVNNYVQVMQTFSPLSGVTYAQEAFTSSAPLTDQPQQSQPSIGF